VIGLEDFDLSAGSTYKEEDLSQWPAHLFQFSARDMARLGLLMLRMGKWQDKQVIPESWVEKSTGTISTAEKDPAINEILDLFGLEGILTGYGYMWWTGETTGATPLYCALGSNQNLIAVMPTLDTVVVMRMQSGGYDTMFEILAELLEAHPALEPND
jgi:CubicO group peptidase (beta-lactamase class C family)